jgi:hypothetical protein
LALCDYRSVDPEDFLEADRVFPDRVGEVYYLKYSKKHRWFWLEGQKQSEPFVFIMYDTMVGDQAKCKIPLFKSLLDELINRKSARMCRFTTLELRLIQFPAGVLKLGLLSSQNYRVAEVLRSRVVMISTAPFVSHLEGFYEEDTRLGIHMEMLEQCI